MKRTTRNNSKSKNREYEEILREAYEQTFGWIEKGKPRCIYVPDEVSLPERASQEVAEPFSCCVNKTSNCLYTICKDFFSPPMISWDLLETVHSKRYLRTVRINRKELYKAFEVYEVEDGHLNEQENAYLDAILKVTGGVILSSAIAFARGSCLVLNGAMHHASYNGGAGFCLFLDVPLAWLHFRKILIERGIKENPKALYIDVDVHHSDGFAKARHQLQMEDHFYMFDLYNEDIYPFDDPEDDPCTTQKYLNIDKKFNCGISGDEYLELFREGLAEIDEKVGEVDLVFYICNNDALEGDLLGGTEVKAKDIIQRDHLLMQWVTSKNLPVVIMPGPGYSEKGCNTARISMEALQQGFGIW